MRSDTNTSVFIPTAFQPACASSAQVDKWLPVLATLKARVVRRPTLRAELGVFVEEEGHDIVPFVIPVDKDAPTAVIFGSHECCDVVLDESASLRHAVVLVFPCDDGAFDVEVLDLRTSSGIGHLGLPVKALRAKGAVVFSAGASQITVVTAGAHENFPAWPDELDDRIQAGSATACAGIGERPVAMSPAQSRFLNERNVELTMYSVVAKRTQEQLKRAERGPGQFRRGVLSIDASSADLDRGIVIGRHPRCDHAATTNDARISRVHALLVARWGQFFVVDLGSTNGTLVVDGDDANDGQILESRHRVARLRQNDDVYVSDFRLKIQLHSK